MIHHPPDSELLQRYAHHADDGAFAQVVRRYVDFVYSTAVRRLGRDGGRDAHLAEDVTQAVFLILARKAHTIRPGVILSGWLHHATRYVAANALKREARHRRRQQALRDATPRGHTQENTMNDPAVAVASAGGDWEAVAPLLDGALDRLAAKDRDAVLLRFIQGKSHREVGQAIGITEEAARKRVERAVGRLREFFAARGVTLGAAAVAGLLATRTVQAAPLALTGAVASSAANAGSATVTGVAAAPLAKAAMTMMAWGKAKAVAACVAALLVVSGGAVVAVRHVMNPPSRTAAQAPPNPPALPALPVIAQLPTPAAGIKPIEGTVFGIDGEPLLGAEVFLCTPSKGVDAFAPNRRRNPPLVTEKDGKFSFPAVPDDMGVIVVFHPDGFAQVEVGDLPKAPQVFIRPWARIEGLDGQGINLATYKGKYLVLHFTYRWTQDDEWAGLKKARDVFVNDAEVAMLSFHVNPPADLNELKDKLAKLGVTWTQAVAADPKTPLDGAYQRGFNACVIAPDGKVAAKNLRSESLDTELAKVLLERR